MRSRSEVENELRDIRDFNVDGREIPTPAAFQGNEYKGGNNKVESRVSHQSRLISQEPRIVQSNCMSSAIYFGTPAATM
jgi:hypothetical protein